MNTFKSMPDDYLRANYVPAVYQPSIYSINYQKLRDAGIRFISFDIDDTIADLLAPDPPKEAKTLFANLMSMGIEIMLLSNTRFYDRAANFAKRLGIKDNYVAKAEKPLTKHFQKLQDRYSLEKSQMAHVGNSILDDVAGGDAFEITTCLVRRAGITGKVTDAVINGTKAQELEKQLKKRGIWRKHHKSKDGDQYYQLGEIQQHSPNFKGK